MRAVCQPDAVTHIADDDLEGNGFSLMTHDKFHIIPIIPRFLNNRVKIDWGREDDGGLQGRAKTIKDY
jgi:hypothetical protein